MTTTTQKIYFALFFIICVSFSFTSSITLPNDDQFSILDQSIDGINPVSEETVAELFQEWKEKHGKVYKHAKEEEKRFQIFNNNLYYIMEMNSRKGSSSRTGHKVGLNKFADLSNFEFREVYTSKVMKNRSEKKTGHVESFDAPPSSLDWRKLGAVTSVKDQGICGSCWSFSSTGAMEGIHAIVTGDLISLSSQELVDCDNISDGCNGGYMNNAFEWVINNGGIDSESDYPYVGSDSICNTEKINEKVVSIDGYKVVNVDERSLLSAVAGQPVSVAIDGSAIDFQLYTDGIYDGFCSSDPNAINHAVLIVGYGSEGDEEYWIVKNSWGTGWGKDGYIYIKKNTTNIYGVCGINSLASYPTMETSFPPSPYPSPVAPPPSPPPPPPPSPPTPSVCGEFAYCWANETCCCVFELFDYCLLYGCCEYKNAVCCTGGAGNNGGVDFCCPSDYPICDMKEALCLKNEGDYLGVAGKKHKVAKLKLPWSEKYVEKRVEKEEETKVDLQWKRRNPFGVV
ncbi:low-temperature-induced cysteine proteinase-like [Impatiens glandulifera]|uniref:low-temperature-induced cysteine proteinase-like n=1 Tax=Impatiens glandulifera TaxID=253017 RepID=UPI001FB1633F|nr:low-temperature-induced cysteine proteinase-like [Impatiens glandulifera]